MPFQLQVIFWEKCARTLGGFVLNHFFSEVNEIKRLIHAEEQQREGTFSQGRYIVAVPITLRKHKRWRKHEGGKSKVCLDSRQQSTKQHSITRTEPLILYQNFNLHISLSGVLFFWPLKGKFTQKRSELVHPPLDGVYIQTKGVKVIFSNKLGLLYRFVRRPFHIFCNKPPVFFSCLGDCCNSVFKRGTCGFYLQHEWGNNTTQTYLFFP